MSDPVLHIKDSYYFEVPKALCPSVYKDRTDFPAIWGRNDPSYQEWEFHQVYHWLEGAQFGKVPSEAELHDGWHDWAHHDHANAGKPFWRYLNERHAENEAGYQAWKASEVAKAKASDETGDAKAAAVKKAEGLSLEDYLATDHIAAPEVAWFSRGMTQSLVAKSWDKQVKVIQKDYWGKYIADDKAPKWDKATIDAYNSHLSGKILIPQLFGTQRNLYEPESGFNLSKFMIIEAFVALVLIFIFSWVGSRIRPGHSPKGVLWNLLEVFLVFIRDQIARPAIGGHHDEDGHENDHIEAESSGYATATHAKEVDRHAPNGAHAEQKAHHDHHHAHHDHHHHNPFELADSYVPMLWTIFLFILGCNLCGMIPWTGTPTGAWGVTLGLAIATFATVVIAGVSQFGPLGFLANQVPTMDVPFPMNLVIKPMIFVIEIAGLLIKHAVLSIRLLANMVAGHLVLLGIMGITFSAGAADFFLRSDTPAWIYPVAATASILASTALSLLEFGVAFLQAYVFTLLSALFIGAAVHKH